MRSEHERTALPGLPGPGLRSVLDELPAVVGIFSGPDLILVYANPKYGRMAGKPSMVGRPASEVFGEPENARFVALLRETFRAGRPTTEPEREGVLAHPVTGEPARAWFDFAYVPLRDADGAVKGVVLHAVEVTRLVEARGSAEESERRLRLLSEAGVVGVVTADGDRILEANDTFLELVGRTREELERGELSWREMTPPEWLEISAEAFERVRLTGGAAPFEKEYERPDGARVPVIVGSVRLEADPLRAMTFVIDQSARRAAETEREQLLERERASRRDAEVTVQRIGRLQRATAALAAAVSAAQVGDVTVTRAMEALGADAGALGLVDEREIVLVHDRGYDEEAGAWRRFAATRRVPLAEAVRTGVPVLVEDREAWARWPEVIPAVSRFEALAAIPLVAAGRVLGAITLSFARPLMLSPADRAFLLALADQAAQALDRARLYEQRSYVARTLQAGLLPERLAEAPGLEVAVRYHSIADGGEVGGDFYDFFDVGDDRWIVAVGDVAGKGSAAAVLTGLARHTLRAIATRQDPPTAMLTFVNEALRRHGSAAALCTLACATVERSDGGFGLCMASGGHPYPLLVRAGSSRVEEVVVRGTLLGVQPDPVLEQVALDLGPGDTLLLRTDGVEDALGPDRERFGDARVAAALAAAAGSDAETVADALDSAVAAFEAGRRRDDRAIVVLRVSS